MGHVTITVHATGAHHNNDNAHDIDRMARAFVDDLKAKGHKVDHAAITAGLREEFGGHEVIARDEG